MAIIVLKVPYGRSYWVKSLGAYWDKITNRWYLDSSIPLSPRIKKWVVNEQPRDRTKDVS